MSAFDSKEKDEPPFNELFESDYQTLQTWWKTIEDVYNHLPTLVAKFLSITPYSASSFGKLEALAKIHRYYTTHAKEKISFINQFKLLDENLHLEESFDLNHQIFGGTNLNDNIELSSKNVVDEKPNYNYDLDSVVDE
ncbi:24539_t:CDS:2, partial [Gigaspora margarita]